MPKIIFQRTYLLGPRYEQIQKRASQVLGKYLDYPNLITFKAEERSVTFSSERLIPSRSTNKPRVMLLFSNPHPYSVHQGMFLSPNTKGRVNLFWPTMDKAGWLSGLEANLNPEQLADICSNIDYEGPFELIFYCYYAFPTEYPEDIRRIFGKEYFTQNIEPEAYYEFLKTIIDTSIKAVVTFNKTIFNRVAKDQIRRYLKRLQNGDLIHSQVEKIDQQIPIFLTFPTGWRYHRLYKQLRKESLAIIETAICRD